jgi:hypothetical protein
MSKGMKRIILSVIVMAFAVAAQAGDAKTCPDKNKDQTGCCASKVKVSTEAKEGCCPLAKAACCQQASAKQTAVKQTALLSPKAAAEASK